MAAYNGHAIDAFDIETGELVYTAELHDHAVHCISLSSVASLDIPVFATSCHGGTLRFAELQTGKVLAKLRSAILGPIFSVCICEASVSLLIAGCYSTIEIWRIPTYRHVASIRGHDGRIMSVLCYRKHPGHIDNENPGFIASGDDTGVLRTWLLEDPWTPLLQIKAHESAILSIVLKRPLDNCNVNKYRLLTAGDDRTLRIFDALSGECLGCVSNHSGPIQAICLLRLNGYVKQHSVSTEVVEEKWQEDIVLTGGLDKRINFWRLSDLSLLHCMERAKPVRGLAVTVVPRPFMIATSMDEGLEIIDLTIYDDLPIEIRRLVRNHDP